MSRSGVAIRRLRILAALEPGEPGVALCGDQVATVGLVVAPSLQSILFERFAFLFAFDVLRNRLAHDPVCGPARVAARCRTRPLSSSSRLIEVEAAIRVSPVACGSTKSYARRSATSCHPSSVLRFLVSCAVAAGLWVWLTHRYWLAVQAPSMIA